MKRLITISLLLLLINELSLGQNAELKGSVSAQNDLTPIEALSVVLFKGTETPYGTVTDSFGEFEILNIKPGSYDLKIFAFEVLVFEQAMSFSNGENRNLYGLKIGNKSGAEELDPTIIGPPRKSEDITLVPLDNGTPLGVEPDVLPKTLVNVREGNNGLQVGGGRPDGTTSFMGNNTGMIGPAPRTFIGLSGVEIIDKGVPARYGNFTGGGVRYQTKQIGVAPERYFQIQTTSPFNGFHHNLGVFYFSKALKTRTKLVNESRVESTLLGVSLQGNYKFQADPNPSVINPFVLTDQTLARIQDNPLVSSEVIGGYVPSATFLGEDDLVRLIARPNANRHDAGGRLKFSYMPNDRVTIDLINSFDLTNRRLSQTNFIPMNSGENPIQKYHFINSQLNISHDIKTVSDQIDQGNQKKFISKLSYMLDLNYQQSHSEVSNFRHRDNFFNYGHVGVFQTARVPTYKYVEDGSTEFIDENGNKRSLSNYYEFQGYRDSLVNFTASKVNPSLGEYTSFFYDKLGESKSIQELVSRGGLLNGQNIPLLYSLYANPGTVYGNYSKSFQERFSATATTYLSIHPHKNYNLKHNLEIGFSFQQDKSSSYNLNAAGLWQLMPLLANSHLQNVDKQQPIFSTDDKGRFTDTIHYPTYVDVKGQKTFDKRLREKLMAMNYVDLNGQQVTNTSYIDVNALSPEVFDLSMFTADELLNNGNPYVSYAGYDYLGNRVRGRQGLQQFLNNKEYRPNDAFAPITAAAWIQDKFVLKTLIIRAGLRFERYDGNQYVLKDPFSVFPVKQVSEVKQINGNAIHHPSSIEEDYVVYVDDVNNPNEIVGYRNGSNWYDAEGVPIADPNILANQSTSGRIQPYLVDPGNQRLSVHSFKKFEAQNLLLPRISISFPLNTTSLFFMSYDKLAQNPSAGQTYLPYTSYYYLQSNISGVLPNPELKARVKTEYNIGFSQAIGYRAGIKISAAYANVVNDVNQFRMEQAYPYSYTTYSNVDFSTIKRYIAEYDYAGPFLSMQASYALQFADGTGSNANSAASLIQSGQPNLRNLFPLAFDNRHTFKSAVTMRFGGDTIQGRRQAYYGPTVMGSRVLKNVQLTFSMQSISGQPYTSIKRAISEAQAGNGVVQRSQTDGNPFGSRMPWTHNLDLNIQRDFKVGGKTLGVYLLVNNVLNTKLIQRVYAYTGSANDDGYLNSPHGQQAAQSQIDAQTFAMLYKLRMDNPGNFGSPRMMHVGAKISF